MNSESLTNNYTEVFTSILNMVSDHFPPCDFPNEKKEKMLDEIFNKSITLTDKVFQNLSAKTRSYDWID